MSCKYVLHTALEALYCSGDRGQRDRKAYLTQVIRPSAGPRESARRLVVHTRPIWGATVNHSAPDSLTS